jgi:hypothetical protein
LFTALLRVAAFHTPFVSACTVNDAAILDCGCEFVTVVALDVAG